MIVFGVNLPLPELFFLLVLFFMIGIPFLIAFTIYKIVTFKIKDDYKKQVEKEIMEKLNKTKVR